MKKTLSIVLALIMLLSLSSLFAGCKKDGDGEGEGTTEATTAAPVISFKYLVSDISKLHIIYPSDASNDVRDLAGEIRDQIVDKFGVTPKFRNDYVNSKIEEFAEAELEILVGRCANREESESFGATVRVNDYGYKIVGKKIVISASSDTNMAQAVQHFIDNVIKASDGKSESVFYSSDSDYLKVGEYAIDSLKLGGKNIYEYTIVYSSANSRQELKHATRLAEAITDISGYQLRIKSDETTEESSDEIRVGATSRNPAIISELGLGADEYSISKADDGAVLVVGQSISGLIGAVDALVADMSVSGKDIAVDLSDAIEGSRPSEVLKAMTFNVLCDRGGSQTYDYPANRAPFVMKMILDQMPDTIGFQEVTTSWMNMLIDGLKDSYGYVGEPRKAGEEYSCVFYRKDKFTLLESGTKWLSDTPDVVGSRFPESSYVRIATYAKLQRKSDGKVFVHLNTHLDHQAAQVEQAGVLLNIARQFGDIPVVLTGDFNIKSDHPAYGVVVKGGFEDSRETASTTDSANTYSNRVIDYLFLTAGAYAYKYDVITGTVTIGSESKVLSDHHPVLLEYYI